jgi:hypothetical protein
MGCCHLTLPRPPPLNAAQLDRSSNSAELTQVRAFLEAKLQESEKEATLLKATVAQALGDLRAKVHACILRDVCMQGGGVLTWG